MPFCEGISILRRKNSILAILIFLIAVSVWPQTDIRQFDQITLIAAEKDMKAGMYLAELLTDRIDQFQIKMGLFPEFRYTIHIAANDKEYQRFTGNAGGIIEFSDAFYSRKDQTAYVRNPADLHSLDKTITILMHEYIHAFVFRYFRNAPLWFHEGMAVYFTEGLPYERFLSFIQLYVFGDMPSLNDMTDHYPKNPVEWEAFYMKSAYAIDYMLKTNPRQFFRFWDSALPVRDFDRSMLVGFQASKERIGARFDEYLRSKVRLEMLVGVSIIIWTLMPFLAIIAWIRKKFVNRKIHREWERLSPAENTDPQLQEDTGATDDPAIR